MQGGAYTNCAPSFDIKGVLLELLQDFEYLVGILSLFVGPATKAPRCSLV